VCDELSDSKVIVQPNHDLPAAESRAGPRFSPRSLFIAATAVCILLALLILPAIQAARQATQRATCSRYLQNIGAALHNYHDIFKTFPPAIIYAADGTPMHSWRVIAKNVVWTDEFYDRYDFREPWNGPKNGLLADEIPDTWSRLDGTTFRAVYECPFCYRCPSAPRTQNPMCTNYVMLIDDRPGKPNGPPNRPGSVPPSFDDKSAVIIIEIADSDIHWMEPRDVLLSELSMKISDRSQRSLSSYHGVACVVHADATVEVLDEATTEERVRELLTQ
jgi:hypothetical protein